MPTKNPLVYIPAKYRKAAYVVLFVASLVVAAWQVSDGNVGNFIAALVTSLLGATAASNTDIQ